MKLENQVVNLELSQQLKEAGYSQEGLWWWCGRTYPLTGLEFSLNDSGEAENWVDGDIFVVPTVAELGERLPEDCHTRKREEGFIPYIDEKGYFNSTMLWNLKADTEANARAKLWLYLKKEGLL